MKKTKLETLTTRVRPEVKTMMEDEAHRQRCTIQELAEKMVIQYLNKASYTSQIEALSLENRETIERWAMAVLSGDQAALNLMNLMEFLIARIDQDGKGRTTG